VTGLVPWMPLPKAEFWSAAAPVRPAHGSV